MITDDLFHPEGAAAIKQESALLNIPKVNFIARSSGIHISKLCCFAL
jgi:hypothetical protein